MPNDRLATFSCSTCGRPTSGTRGISRAPDTVYCASGYRSSLAASLLQANGFSKVQNVAGGYNAWTASELPTIKPEDTNRKAADTER
jgi:hypothetical protein